ncbi:sensor histidine kinase [Saccharopolyspora indica]|uniref:sensor histidine kinase n=1 Tax=Saccharopolyspora indica TaxID=1229659 RepID=UPI0022EB1B67|nr:sensor histidine kinase [Saccharopolyspora indica]MDA3645575.1 sensor histidine kinase [Saccharopolyspora indica]
MTVLRRLPAIVVDLALAVLIAAAVLLSALLNFAVDQSGFRLFDVLMILGTCAVLVLRRRFPVPVALATLAGCVVYYPLSTADGPLLLAFAVALCTVAAEGRTAVAVLLAVAAMLFVGYGEVSSGQRHLDDTSLYLFAGWLVAAVAIGGLVHNRRAYLNEAEQRMRAVEREKEEEARSRASEERLRIARELHDALGHHLSLINVQAGAALHRSDTDPAPALTSIKQASKDALRELRATLGVLRQVDEAGPPPGLARVDDLVAQAGATGLAVRVEVDGEVRPLPPEVDLAGYRIVQEALTNVTRHADARTAFVRIGYTGQDVRVQIDDDGSAVPDVERGNGIRGMEERARALGGEFTAGSGPDGGFRVRAVLPWRSAL